MLLRYGILTLVCGVNWKGNVKHKTPSAEADLQCQVTQKQPDYMEKQTRRHEDAKGHVRMQATCGPPRLAPGERVLR